MERGFPVGLTNAEKQAQWRARRNAKAKLADKVLAPNFDGDQYDRETAIMNLLNTPGAEWTAGFVDMLRRWKPGKIAKRRRRKAADMTLLQTYDVKLPDYSAEVQVWAETMAKQPVNLEVHGDCKLEIFDGKLEIP